MNTKDLNTPNGTHSLCEAVADLSSNFIVAPVIPADSRAMTQLCIEWAILFENKNAGRVWDGEYIEAIDAFFYEKYAEWRECARETRSNEAIEDKQLAKALRDLKRNVETDLHGFWTESTANMVQQADEALRGSRQRYANGHGANAHDRLLEVCEQAEHWLSEEMKCPGEAIPEMMLANLREAIAAAKGGAS